jgi:hypothetical protein
LGIPHRFNDIEFRSNRADEGWALVRRLQQAGYAHPDFVAAFPLARDPQNFGAPSPRAR